MHDLPSSRLRICLTFICGQVVAAEFHHRVHMYQDQGFFTDILVAGANFAMEEREHELAQYFNVNKHNKKTSPGLSWTDLIQSLTGAMRLRHRWIRS